MCEVKRIYPESKTGLINWIEENFHDLDEFIFIYQMKDEEGGSYYDTYSYRNALGMLEIAKDSINEMAREGNFKPKKK
jgi:hypothetical protein